jgi:hypothetical protein
VNKDKEKEMQTKKTGRKTERQDGEGGRAERQIDREP